MDSIDIIEKSFDDLKAGKTSIQQFVAICIEEGDKFSLSEGKNPPKEIPDGV